MLHAGGKFGGSGYKVSGGLHGVGVSVVNALSSRLVLEVDRNDKHYRLEFAKGGQPQGKLEVTGKAPRGRTGTTVTFWPDATVFEETDFRAQTVLERLQMMAFLNRGLEIRFVDERADHEQQVTFKYSGGIQDFVRHLNQAKEALFKKVAYFEQAEADHQVECALQWNTGYYEGIHSFANGIATNEGGMHEEGFKKALTNVVNKYARGKALLKEKDDNFLGEDIREGLTAIVAVQAPRPAVRGSDQGQARQRVDALARREGHEREAGRVAGGAPDRGAPDRAEVAERRTGACRGAPGPRPHASQVSARRCGHARQALGLQHA